MDWKAHLAEANSNLDQFRKSHPDGAGGFTALHRGSMQAGALDKKQKELIAIGIGISTRCLDCIGFHVKAAIAQGASRDEVADTIAVAVMMGGGPAYMYGVKALEAYDQLA